MRQGLHREDREEEKCHRNQSTNRESSEPICSYSIGQSEICMGILTGSDDTNDEEY